jgi:hypothetical protein
MVRFGDFVRSKRVNSSRVVRHIFPNHNDVYARRRIAKLARPAGAFAHTNPDRIVEQYFVDFFRSQAMLGDVLYVPARLIIPDNSHMHWLHHFQVARKPY